MGTWLPETWWATIRKERIQKVTSSWFSLSTLNYDARSTTHQNCRWASENPRALHQRPLHSPKVTVWCAVTKEFVIGPYFFEVSGVTVTVIRIDTLKWSTSFSYRNYTYEESNKMEPQLIRLELRWTLCDPYSIIMSSRDLAMFRGLPVRPICQHVTSSSGAFLSPVCMRVSHVNLRNWRPRFGRRSIKFSPKCLREWKPTFEKDWRSVYGKMDTTSMTLFSAPTFLSNGML